MGGQEKKPRTRAGEWAVYAGIVVLAALGMALGRGLFQAPDVSTAAGILSDCLMVPGVFLAGIGGISFSASRGIYDPLSFAVRRFAVYSLFTGRRDKRPENYYEFKKQQEKKERKWSPAMLVTGLCALALSAVCLVVYAVA